MILKDFIGIMNGLAPVQFSEGWDNPGLLVGDADMDISRVYIALDATSEVIEAAHDAGADLIPDTCPDQPVWHYLIGKVGVTESPKCAYYPRRRGINFVLRSLDDCIEAALTGEVK